MLADATGKPRRRKVLKHRQFGKSFNGVGIRLTENPTVSLPDTTGMSVTKAELAIAKAGVPVVPIRPGTKNPGSYLGRGWPELATCDPATIRARRRRFPKAGIGIHPGPGGLLVIDVDSPDSVPEWLWPLLDTALFRPTTTDPDSRRGHYFYSLRPGDQFGSGVGGLGKGWGEVRCFGGAIILHPTEHPNAPEGHAYSGAPGGPVPLLPDDIADKLHTAPAADNTRAMLTAGELDDNAKRFLATYTADREPHALTPILEGFGPAPGGRHGSMFDQLCWAMREGKAGRFPAKRAVDELQGLWAEAIGGAHRNGDADEFDRMLRDAVHVADNSGTVEELWARAHRLPIDEDEFWEARDVLRDLRLFARARRVGPWAMLGCVLTLAVGAIPPYVVLPPLVGDVASLNSFVALVGRSGESKSAAMAAARAWLGVDPEPEEKKPGSGEGLAKCFAYIRRSKNNPPAQIGKAWSVLATIPEVDTLTATGGRGGATIMSALREGWSGERLGNDYAGEDKSVTINRHRYRLGLLVGVQPLRAAPLFAEADAGTPQRFLWLPVRDTERIEDRPDEPPRRDLRSWPVPDNTLNQQAVLTARLHLPDDPQEFVVLDVPPSAAAEIDAAALDRSGPESEKSDPLDGHRLLCQEKVAAALMFLDGRTDGITEQDWQLAGQVIAVSNQTRAKVQADLAREHDRQQTSAGRSAGVRKIAEARTVADEEKKNIDRIAKNIVRKLVAAETNSLSGAALKRAIKHGDRALIPKALEHLEIDRTVKVDEVTKGGQIGVRVRLIEGRSSKHAAGSGWIGC